MNLTRTTAECAEKYDSNFAAIYQRLMWKHHYGFLIPCADCLPSLRNIARENAQYWPITWKTVEGRHLTLNLEAARVDAPMRGRTHHKMYRSFRFSRGHHISAAVAIHKPDMPAALHRKSSEGKCNRVASQIHNCYIETAVMKTRISKERPHRTK